jgi:hypothetical protein
MIHWEDSSFLTSLSSSVSNLDQHVGEPSQLAQAGIFPLGAFVVILSREYSVFRFQ